MDPIAKYTTTLRRFLDENQSTSIFTENHTKQTLSKFLQPVTNQLAYRCAITDVSSL